MMPKDGIHSTPLDGIYLTQFSVPKGWEEAQMSTDDEDDHNLICWNE